MMSQNNNNDFVHLHVHSTYSLLDGACQIKELIKQVKKLGQTSVALTDHGYMYGIIPFYNEAKTNGINPILGCEVYVARRTRFDRVHTLDSKSHHLVLLCENLTGYHNLIKLISFASTEGFYSRPRVDLELLSKYHEGLICLSACLAGEIPRYLTDENYEEAKKAALRYQNIFGKQSFFLEVQNHQLKEQIKILPDICRLSKETGIPLVATNDVHYITKNDAEVQRVLLGIQTGKSIDDKNFFGLSSNEFYLKSTDEMKELFSFIPEAIYNTKKIADRCHIKLETNQIYLPKFKMDGIEDTKKFFFSLCKNGLYKRYGKNPDVSITNRMQNEIDVIERMGYIDYFLIVWDYVNFARTNNIPVGPGRGSGAGSICAYCLEITQIDPIKYNLLFERFLNPERISMPDFDIDFCIEGRQAVKEYVIKRYGADYVSEIITFDVMKARGAIRDVGRVINCPYSLCDKIAKMLDSKRTIAETMEAKDAEDFRTLYNDNPQAHHLIDMAMKIEGIPRHPSTHAAGVIISAIPISNLVPLQKNDETIITQYTMIDLEQLGLLKFDFLGLRNLTVIRDCINTLKNNGINLDIEKIPIDDKSVYDMMSQGNSIGVFQFESAGMKNVLTQLKPENLEDLTAVLSLYRPGPRDSIPKYIENRRHPENISYLHESLEPILKVTNGCMIYQEQVMEICRVLAGYSYGRADIVRRAMSKKKTEVMEHERNIFLYGSDGSDGSSPCSGAVKNRVPVEIAKTIFDEIAKFASYAFNKSHAVAYAFLAYQTAYLKVHYFSAYMSALMTSVMDDTSKLLIYISECQNNGIKILPPHINKSIDIFQQENDCIRFSLSAVKNTGKALVKRIIKSREKDGDFKNLRDFCRRIRGTELNKRALECLICSGAFDGLGMSRKQMMEQAETTLIEEREAVISVLEGQMNLFDDIDKPKNNYKSNIKEEYSESEILALEKDAVGIYLSGNPLQKFCFASSLLHTKNISDIIKNNDVYEQIQQVNIIAIIQNIKTHITKKGDRMCFITFEDSTGQIDGVVFSDLYNSIHTKLKKNSAVLVKGKISSKESSVSILCDSILDEQSIQRKLMTGKLCIKLNSSERNTMQFIIDKAIQYPGKNLVCFYLIDKNKMIIPKQQISTSISKNFYNELKNQIPESSIGII